MRAVCASPASSERLRARHDLDDLARDRRLTHLVHVERQARRSFRGVAGRRVHRGHPRGVLGGGRFEQRAIDLHLDVAAESAREKLLRRRLVEVVDLRRAAGISSLDGAAIGSSRSTTTRCVITDLNSL